GRCHRARRAGARDALGQVSDYLGELVQERLLGKLDRLLEACPDSFLLLPVKLRRDADQVIRRLDVGIVPGDAEESDQSRRVISRVEQRSESLSSGLLQLLEASVERF